MFILRMFISYGMFFYSWSIRLRYDGTYPSKSENSLYAHVKYTHKHNPQSYLDTLIHMKILYTFLCRFVGMYILNKVVKRENFYSYKFSVDFITCVVVVRALLNQEMIFYIESDIITYLNLFRHFYLLICTYMVYLINKILNSMEI